MRIHKNTLVTGPGILSGASGIFRIMEAAGDSQIDILDCFILWIFMEQEKEMVFTYS